MSWIEKDDIIQYIECVDYFDNDGENEMSETQVERVAKLANEYLVEQLMGNDWFTSLCDACISDALAWGGWKEC